MTTLTQQYVATLSDTVKEQLIVERDLFERDGMIGDCALRYHAETFMATYKISDHCVHWMDSLAAECDRFFARRAMQDRADAARYRKLWQMRTCVPKKNLTHALFSFNSWCTKDEGDAVIDKLLQQETT